MRPRLSHLAHVGTLRSHLIRRLLQTRQSIPRVSKVRHRSILTGVQLTLSYLWRRAPVGSSSRLASHISETIKCTSHWTEKYPTGKHHMCALNTSLYKGMVIDEYRNFRSFDKSEGLRDTTDWRRQDFPNQEAPHFTCDAILKQVITH